MPRSMQTPSREILIPQVTHQSAENPALQRGSQSVGATRELLVVPALLAEQIDQLDRITLLLGANTPGPRRRLCS